MVCGLRCRWRLWLGRSGLCCYTRIVLAAVLVLVLVLGWHVHVRRASQGRNKCKQIDGRFGESLSRVLFDCLLVVCGFLRPVYLHWRLLIVARVMDQNSPRSHYEVWGGTFPQLVVTSVYWKREQSCLSMMMGIYLSIR
ncbi:hypothetical protein GGR58DRAFT_242890 [Xylaria digitata]|nr:hypothetical protein GGR58DRAFT_242890 [Xylaria digitata]